MIRVLGSGSAGNAVLVGHDKPVLLDAGIPLKRLRSLLRENGVTRLTQLAFALVTHEHQDHACAVEGLLDATVDVAASRGTLEALGVADHHRAEVVPPLREVSKGPWRFIGLPLKHDAKEPMGFYLGRNGGLRVLYVTDTGSFEPPSWVSRPTHVLIEANHRRSEMERRAEFDDHAMRVSSSHLSVEGAMEALAQLDLSCCESIHLLHVSDRHGDEAGFVAEVSAEFGVPVHAAQAV